jgi:phage shock protein PspC (stress-responsive transcriptional regulator)
MNKVVSINLNGFVFNIEEQAYDKLKAYMDGLRRHFQGTDGAPEIISDIESRIAELLQLKITERHTVVQLTDVEEVIGMMGDPRQIAGETEGEEQPRQESSAFTSSPRFRRDPRNKVIGGVCAGAANYLNIDPLIPRALFLISFFVFGSGLLLYVILWIALPPASPFDLPDRSNVRVKRLFRNPDERSLGGVCSGVANYIGVDTVWVRIAFLIALFVYGTGVLLYLILWMAIPLARTAADKLQMRGEPVDVSNIERKVRETFSGTSNAFRGRMDTESDNLSNARVNVNRGVSMAGDALNMVLRLAGKLFGLLITVIGLLVILCLLMSLTGIGEMDRAISIGKMFAGSDKVFVAAAAGIGLFVFSVGMMFLVGGIKLLFNLNYRTRVFNVITGVLSFFGILLTLYAAGSYAASVDEEDTVVEKLSLETVPDTLYLSVNHRWDSLEQTHKQWNVSARGTDWRCASFSVLKNDGVLFRNGRLIIKPSDDKTMQVNILKGARGAGREEARQVAETIDYRVELNSPYLVFDDEIFVPYENSFRYQRSLVRMKVPVGTIIHADHRIPGMLNRATDSDRNLGEGTLYRMSSGGLECIDCTELKHDQNWEDDSGDSRRKRERIRIDMDDEDEGSKQVEIHIGSSDHDEEGVHTRTETDGEGDRVEVKKEVTKVGPVYIEETVKKKDR